MIEIPDNKVALLLNVLEEAITYQEILLENEVLMYREDYEEFHFSLTQFYSEIFEEYKEQKNAIEISENWSPALISAFKNTLEYKKVLLRDTKITEKEYNNSLQEINNFFLSIQKAYKKHEDEIGIPLERLL